jgi:hypothetical protein
VIAEFTAKPKRTKRGTTPALPGDDLDSGVFMYRATPAKTPGGEHSNQRYFGGNHSAINKNNNHTARCTVYRFESQDNANLDVDLRVSGAADATIAIHLTAAELQTLACALLDAAHDLRTHPAASFASATTGAAA